MCVITDPSCFEEGVKKRDYLCHIFSATMETYPAFRVGDVVRIYKSKVEERECKKLDFRVYNEKLIVVFPMVPGVCPDRVMPHTNKWVITLTEEDITRVQKIQRWAIERRTSAVTAHNIEPHLITLSVTDFF